MRRQVLLSTWTRATSVQRLNPMVEPRKFRRHILETMRKAPDRLHSVVSSYGLVCIRTMGYVFFSENECDWANGFIVVLGKTLFTRWQMLRTLTSVESNSQKLSARGDKAEKFNKWTENGRGRRWTRKGSLHLFRKTRVGGGSRNFLTVLVMTKRGTLLRWSN